MMVLLFVGVDVCCLLWLLIVVSGLLLFKLSAVHCCLLFGVVVKN